MRFHSVVYNSKTHVDQLDKSPSKQEIDIPTYDYYALTTKTSTHTTRTSSDRYLRVKSILQHQLHCAELSNAPAGFPFRYIANIHGDVELSYAPYEFKQQVSLSRSWEPRADHWVTIGYTPPSHLNGRCYTWKIDLPAPTHYSELGQVVGRLEARIVSAEVKIDTTIPQTPYFAVMQGDPRIISQALALSLEYEVALEIRVLDSELLSCLGDSRHGSLAGDIVYIGTDTMGGRQILLVLDARCLEPRYSATTRYT